MISAIEIDLGELGVCLPRGDVAMVVAQPYVKFTDEEPFTWAPGEKHRALQCIADTLDVSRQCPHGADRTHFTIFPECAIPGLEGVDQITAALQADDWPRETIVIGGVDGLTRAQFVELVGKPNTTFDEIGNPVARITAGQWVNCVITWAKLRSGAVMSWVQPKLSPAWVELDVECMSMYRGKSIYIFKGLYSNADAPYQFATLLCFDWIGSADAKRMWEWLLEAISDKLQLVNGTLPLTWLFVAQCNPAPSHASFMGQVAPFFDQARYPRVNREDTCLVMANVAGKRTPGRIGQYGQSAVIFTQNRFVRPGCMPTYGNGGVPQRGGNFLENFLDAVFRERGACIHSFLAIHPSTLPPGSAGRRFALREPTVHPFEGMQDPRVPGGAVPAVIKWINDEFDDTQKSLASQYRHVPLGAAAVSARAKTVTGLRTLEAGAVNKTVKFASPSVGERPADDWKVDEGLAVTHLLNTFSILDIAQYPAMFHGKGAQATITKGDSSLEVVAVMGSSHEDCDKHVLDCVPTHKGALLIISRDEDNNSWDQRFKSIYDQVPEENTLEAKFTEPTSAIIRVGYRDVLDAYMAAGDQSELRTRIDAKLS